MRNETTQGNNATMEHTQNQISLTPLNSFRVLSIDAWRGCEGGWDWNNWHDVGRAPVETLNYTPRRLLAWFRNEGYLSAQSAGRLAVQDDGYNLVILDRRNGCPLYAIEYGRGV